MRYVTALLVLGLCVAAASSTEKPPSEVHLLLPYPAGKADSVLATKDPLVFIPEHELNALEQAVEATVVRLPDAPVRGVVSSVVVTGEIRDDAAALKAVYVVDLLEDGWLYVPLVGKETPVLSAVSAREELVLSPGGQECVMRQTGPVPMQGYWGALIRGPGRKEIEVDLLLPVTASDGGGFMDLLFPPVGAMSFSLRLPPGQWHATSSVGKAMVKETEGAQLLEVSPGRGGAMRLTWRPRIKRITRISESAKTARIEVNSQNLLSLGEAALKGSVNFKIEVRGGQAQLLKVAIPEGVEVMEVRGANVDTWEQEGPEMLVYLAAPVRGQEQLFLEYLVNLDGPSGIVSVPAFVVGGAQRQRGEWAVVATTNIEVELEGQEGVEVLQARELADELRGRVAGRILQAFRGDPAKMHISLRISRHRDVPVLVAVIDDARISTVVYPTGEHVTSCTYVVRNTTKQFLELILPPHAELWHVRVNRQPVRPGMVNGKVLLPLASSVGRGQEQAFPVELTYMIPRAAPGLFGLLEIQGPSPDLPCSRLAWTVNYPDQVRPVRWGGNVELVKGRSVRGLGEISKTSDDLRIRGGSAGEIFYQADEPIHAPSDSRSRLEGSTSVRDFLEQGEKAELDRMYEEKAAYDRKGGKLLQQLRKQGRRNVGKPSVSVRMPEVGNRVEFRQILQKDEKPTISCWYVQAGSPGRLYAWAIGLLVVLLILLRVARQRRAGAALLVLLLFFGSSSGEEQSSPREVLRMVPQSELEGLFAGGSRQEQVFLPISRVRNLIAKLGDPARFVPAVTSSFLDGMSLVVSVGEDEALVEGSGAVVSVGPGWRYMDLLSSSARPAEILLDGEAAPLWTQGQGTRLLVEGEKSHVLHMKYHVSVSSQGNSRTVSLPLPPTGGMELSVVLPRGSSGLKVDGKRIDLVDDGDSMTGSMPLMGNRSVQLTWRFVPPELVLPSAVRPREGEPGRGKLLAEGLTLFSVDAGVIEGRTGLTIDIIQGVLDTLAFDVSPGMELLEVSSSSMVDWVVEEADTGQMLIVLLKPQTKGRVYLDLLYELQLPDTVTSRMVLEPALRGAMRFRGEMGVQVLTSLRVTSTSQDGATRTDPADLPTILWNRAENPILLAFKYIDPAYRVGLKLEQQQDIALLTASVDREDLLTVVSPAGRAVHRALFTLRNSGEQFLRVVLPENVQIWSYMVNGQSFAPGRSEDGSYRLPVSASRERDGKLAPLQLELVWVEEHGALPPMGKMELSGPELDLPCSVVDWTLYLPSKRNWFRFGSNLTKTHGRARIMTQTAVDNEDQQELTIMRQLNIAQAPASSGGAGLEAGAMPVKVSIPLEGERKDFSRVMLLGGTPTIAAWSAAPVPPFLGAIVGMVVLLLLWRYGPGFSFRRLFWVIVLTGIIIYGAGYYPLIGAAVGLIWKWRAGKRASYSMETQYME